MIRVVIALCAIAGAWRLYQISTPEFWIEIGKLVAGVIIASTAMGIGLFSMALYYRAKDYRRWKRMHNDQ